MSEDKFSKTFPTMATQGFVVTSKETDDYNCIAWANEDTQQWWWPVNGYGCYWPPDVPFDNKRSTLIRIFQNAGYEECDSHEMENGYEKVAIYELPGDGVQHAARQLPCGEWTSKLGSWEDVRHKTPHSVENGDYGQVVQIMKRCRRKEDEGSKKEREE